MSPVLSFRTQGSARGVSGGRFLHLNRQKMNRLNPSFFRAAANVFLWLLITVVFGYFSQGLSEDHWWTPGYIFSLSVPFVLMICSTWMMFVPRCLEYDERILIIHFWLRGRQSRSWEDLRYYGGACHVFLIQFGSVQAFQIFSGAYSRAEWRNFTGFLRTRFPDKQATGWLGPFGFKWKRKKADQDGSGRGGKNS